MNSKPGFGDQAQIDLIKERLWGERELGRAAVMIGSGFSRNAEARSPSAGLFPLWSGLTSAMLEALYPEETTPEDERRRRELRYGSAAGATRLAGEYAALFGREALNDLLFRLIPDDGYRPGHLHRLLLSLPWSDVFTTNYDTLLEGAAQRVYDRKYGVVASPEDIPGQEQPRIVKLHGSFPHQRPFIITEEDFRTYRERFAPFVNLVQQSAQENVLVLLGFSGEDPNFLSWTGWVRDYLGEHAPTVYLCDLLDLSASERMLLADRNVVPIDLSPKFLAEEWSDRDERHRKAIEWFLLNLMSGRPPDPDDWLGRGEARNQWEPSAGLPRLPRSWSFTYLSGAPPYSGLDSADQALETVEVWRNQREEYPGWVVAPREKRERLAEETQHWIEAVLDAASGVTPQEGLDLLFELNWRLERALVPLFTDWVEKITSVLERINPYPSTVEIPGATVTPRRPEYRGLDWHRLTERWVELTFAVARTAREDQNEPVFRRWMDLLKGVVDRRPEWRARWFYEECQYRLFRGDQDGLRMRLGEWPEEIGGPAWALKRSALLAELGEVHQANRLAEGCLERIREQLQPGSRDLALLSLEGWAMALLRVVQPNLPIEMHRKEDFRRRLRVLAPLGCDPSRELYETDLVLAGPTPEERAGVKSEVFRGFDPGSESTTVRFGSGLAVLPFFPAFGFARMLEEGTLPPRCGNVTVQKEAVLNAARWIEPYAPLWSLSLLLRAAKTGEPKELEDRFDRVRVATLATEEVERLFDTFLEAWVQAIKYLVDNMHEVSGNVTGFAERQVRVLSDVLSRLSIRLDEARRAQMLNLALEMYSLPLFGRFLKLYDCVALVFARLLSQATNQPEVLNRMDQLLSLPIPGEGGFGVAQPSEWPEPFVYLAGWSPGGGFPAGFDRSSWTPHVERLIFLVRSGSTGARRRAVLRLDRLFGLGVLEDGEKIAFGEALWSKIDPTSNLPLQTGYSAFGFLTLPHPADIDVEGRVRTHLLAKDFPRVVVGDGAVMPRGEDALAQELRGGTTPLIAMTEEEWRAFVVDWSPEEAASMLHKMRSLWDREKEVLRGHLGSSFGLPGGDLAGRFRDWLRLLAEVILPRLAEADDTTKETASSLIGELQDAGVPTSYAASSLLYLDDGRFEEAFGQLWEGMGSQDPGEVGEAIRGVVLWLTLRARGSRIPPPPDRLLDEMVNRTIARKMPGLDWTLTHLTNLLRLHPEQLETRHLDGACTALRYLMEDIRPPSAQERRDLKGAVPGLMPPGERPRYRALSASLASRLYARYADLGKPIPEVLGLWREASRSATLPEVRRAWWEPSGC